MYDFKLSHIYLIHFPLEVKTTCWRDETQLFPVSQIFNSLYSTSSVNQYLERFGWNSKYRNKRISSQHTCNSNGK